MIYLKIDGNTKRYRNIGNIIYKEDKLAKIG